MVANTDEPVFTADDYRLLKRLQRDLKAWRDKNAKAQQCGIDCSENLAYCDGMEHFCNTLEEVFMTPPPDGALAPPNE